MKAKLLLGPEGKEVKVQDAIDALVAEQDSLIYQRVEIDMQIQRLSAMIAALRNAEKAGLLE